MNTEDLHRNCILFGEWLCFNYMPFDNSSSSTWFNPEALDKEEYTTIQLFEIYLKTIK